MPGPNDQRAGRGALWVLLPAWLTVSRSSERNFILTVPLSTPDKKQKNIGELLEASLQNAEGGGEKVQGD